MDSSFKPLFFIASVKGDCAITHQSGTMDGTISIPKDLQITPDFQRALDLMNDQSGHVFVSGDAGSGKSTLLAVYCDQAEYDPVVVAPTGVAAVNVGGQTIHSFFGLPVGILARGNINYTKRRAEVLKNVKSIIIDEVSMVRADLMDAVNESLRIHRDCEEPFGGVKMILIGDLCQLPPVVRKDDEAILAEMGYDSPFFFSSNVIKSIRLNRVTLREVFRQKDEKFLGILNRMRSDNTQPSDLNILNQRFGKSPSDKDTFISLTSTNAAADSINEDRLSKLHGKAFLSVAEIEGDFDISHAPTDVELKLKVGAQVMMVRNDKDSRWVNGTVGTIECVKKCVKVRVGDDVFEVEKEKWSKVEYSFDRDSGVVNSHEVGSFIQYPMRLAWAITIHKSQGRTYDKVRIDLGYGAFAHGQTYVALSRCRTLDGIFLSGRIRQRDIIVDRRVIEFSDR